nr:FAD:protein FMN transferase [uncultured Aminipila sp.]
MKTPKILTCMLLCTAIIISQTSCSAKEKEPVSDTQYDLLNTTCTITIYDMNQSAAQDLIDEAFSLCKDYENKLSKTIKGSDIYRINHSNGSPTKVSASTATLVQKGIYYGNLSEGRFDITVGKLSSLWDFSSDKPKVPSEEKILEAIKTIDYTKIHLEKESVTGTNQNQEIHGNVWIDDPNTELDLGGIAKGYIADRVSDYLVDKGVNSAIVNLGGNIVAIGTKKDGSAWNIGVEKPFSGRRQIVGSVQVKNKTVVTSGIYERMFKENGVLYHHILDVKTGYPAETDVEAVTLVADFGKSVDCDALSTTCLMLGVKKGTALIESIDGIEAAFIDKNGNISVTSGMDFTPAE